MFRNALVTLAVLGLPLSGSAGTPNAPSLTPAQTRALTGAINRSLTQQLKKDYDFPAKYLRLVSPQDLRVGSKASDGFVIGETGRIRFSLASKTTQPGAPSFVPQIQGPFVFAATLAGKKGNMVKNLIVEPSRTITLPPYGQPQ